MFTIIQPNYYPGVTSEKEEYNIPVIHDLEVRDLMVTLLDFLCSFVLTNSGLFVCLC